MTPRASVSIMRLDVEARGLTVADAALPENYTATVAAIAELAEIDQCKEWADRAEALRSYARQADDPRLLAYAMRVKARAVRRCGEMINEIEPAKFNGNQHVVRETTLPNHTRKQAASDAGMSEWLQKQAQRVANVPHETFEAAVESANPPSVTRLADMGRKRRAPGEEHDPVEINDEDWLPPHHSDELLTMIVDKLRHGLMDLPPGIRDCVRDAVSRASQEDRDLLTDRRDLLNYLME